MYFFFLLHFLKPQQIHILLQNKTMFLPTQSQRLHIFIQFLSFRNFLYFYFLLNTFQNHILIQINNHFLSNPITTPTYIFSLFFFLLFFHRSKPQQIHILLQITTIFSFQPNHNAYTYMYILSFHLLLIIFFLLFFIFMFFFCSSNVFVFLFFCIFIFRLFFF